MIHPCRGSVYGNAETVDALHFVQFPDQVDEKGLFWPSTPSITSVPFPKSPILTPVSTISNPSFGNTGHWLLHIRFNGIANGCSTNHGDSAEGTFIMHPSCTLRKERVRSPKEKALTKSLACLETFRRAPCLCPAPYSVRRHNPECGIFQPQHEVNPFYTGNFLRFQLSITAHYDHLRFWAISAPGGRSAGTLRSQNPLPNRY